jgi:putative peptide zinc metalloprotease protein
LFVLLLAFMPLERAVEIPAVLHAGSYTRLYAPIPARVDAVLVNEGQRVERGDILFSLSSPDLEFNIDLVKERLQALQDVRDSSQATLPLAQKRVTIDSEIEKTRQELRGFIAVRDQLTVRAEFSGIVRDLDETLRPGRWIGRQDLLALLVDDSRPVLSGYVRERDVTRIHEGGKGTFYPEYAVSARYDVTLDDVEPVRVNEIYWPELSSVHNGPVPSERAGEGLIKDVPRHVYYPVRFEMKPDVPQAALPDFIARGTVRVEAAPTSTAKMLFKKALSVIIREGGF